MKKFISLFLSIAMLLSITAGLDLTAYADTYSGTCGDNLTWSLDTDTGVLTIEGSGNMKSYSSASSVPWYSYRTSITDVELPSDLTSIGNYAFYYCTKLTSVTIGNGVTSIESYAFYYCTKLTSVTIPDSVTSIGKNAFSYCTNLTSFTIPDGVTSIGSVAFYYCTSLTSVTISNSVTSIGDQAFEYCTCLTSIDVDENNKYYSSQDGVLFNNNKTNLICYPAGKTETSYEIPESVTRIGDRAFYYCISLTSITIPNSVTSIYSWAFGYCTNLTSVTIPDSVTYIEFEAFAYCYSLTSVTIPDSVTYIDDNTFSYCTSLTSIIIPDSVTSIYSWAFSHCTSLTSITISDSVISIGNYAFYYCTSLTDVYYAGSEDDWNNISIGSSNTYLTNATIHYNYSSDTDTDTGDTDDNTDDFLYYEHSDGTCEVYQYVGTSEEVVVPESIDGYTVTTFTNTFGISGNYNIIKSITLPKTITDISSGLFAYCNQLEEINVDSTNTEYTSIDGVLFTIDKTSLVAYPREKQDETYTIPTSVNYVCSKAFYNCSNLTLLKATHTMKYEDSYIMKNMNDALTVKLMAGSELHVNAVREDIDYETVDIYDYYSIDGFDLKEDGYTFPNSSVSFGYSSNYKLPYSTFESVFGSQYTKQQYESVGTWGGNCYGMSVSAAMFQKGLLRSSDYGSSIVNEIYDSFSYNYGIYKVDTDSEITKLIEEYQVWQSSTEASAIGNSMNSAAQSYAGLFLKALDIINITSEPLIVLLNWSENGQTKGHALVVDSSRKPEELNNNWWKIYLYDCNYPNPTATKLYLSDCYDYCNDRYLYVNVENGQWRISASSNSDSSDTAWIGYDEDGTYIPGSYIYFMSTEGVTTNVSSGQASFLPDEDSNETCINIYSDNIDIYDENETLVFSVVDGGVEYISDDVNFYQYIGDATDTDSVLSGKVTLTKGTYKTVFNDSGKAQILNSEYFVGLCASENSEITVNPDGNVTAVGETDNSDNIVIEKVESSEEYTSIETNVEYEENIEEISLSLNENKEFSSTVSSVTVNVISDETDGEEYEITDYTSDLSSESISSIAIEDGIKIDVCNHYSQKIKDSKEATCTECGYTGDVVCNNCGEILEYGTTTDIITHSYSATVTEPTCTENGYTTYTCSICGDTYVDDETEATGHSYNNGEVTTAATCTTDGVKTYTCTECGETYTESIPATGHSYNTTVIAPTCTTKGYTLNTCENCSDSYKNTYVDVLGHDYSVLQSKAVSATCASTGKTAVYKCSRCPSTTGGTTIAKLAHTYKNVVTKATLKKNGKITPTCSVCGATKSATTIYYPKTIKLSATSYTYDKKKHKPSVTVKDSKGNTISSKYYTVTYSNSKSKSVGKYTVTIKFKGNYSGTKTLTYTIKPKSTSISKITAKSKGFTVKWKKQATQTTGYQIQYSTSSNFSNAKTVTISKTGTTSKTISKLKSKKKYYVRVRTYKTVKVNGKSTKIYSSWSKTKTVTTKK